MPLSSRCPCLFAPCLLERESTRSSKRVYCWVCVSVVTSKSMLSFTLLFSQSSLIADPIAVACYKVTIPAQVQWSVILDKGFWSALQRTNTLQIGFSSNPESDLMPAFRCDKKDFRITLTIESQITIQHPCGHTVVGSFVFVHFKTESSFRRLRYAKYIWGFIHRIRQTRPEGEWGKT